MLVLLYFFPYSGPETGATEQDASSGKSQNERPIQTDLGRAQRKAPETEPISRLLFIIDRRYRCRNDMRAQASRAGWRVQAFSPCGENLGAEAIYLPRACEMSLRLPAKKDALNFKASVSEIFQSSK